jgi:type IV pilus assembly protein PilB
MADDDNNNNDGAQPPGYPPPQPPAQQPPAQQPPAQQAPPQQPPAQQPAQPQAPYPPQQPPAQGGNVIPPPQPPQAAAPPPYNPMQAPAPQQPPVQAPQQPYAGAADPSMQPQMAQAGQPPQMPPDMMQMPPADPMQPPEQQPQISQQEAMQPGAGGSEPVKKMRLGEKLMSLGLISEDQLGIALMEQRQNKKLIGQILVDMNFLTESALGEVLAESSGAEKFESGATMLDPSLLKMIPKEVCMRNKIMPIEIEADGTVKVIMADVYNVLAIDQIRRHLPKGTNVKPLFCTETEIVQLIDQYYEYEVSIDGILREIETGIRDNTQLDGRDEGYVNPTVRLVNALLIDAIKQDTSDIHFEPEGTFLRLRYRIDGKLQQIRSFHRDYWAAMLVRMKIISGMNIAESRNPQDGRIGFKALGREIDFRVATQPTVHGENVVLRILDKSKALMPMDKLGFTEHNEKLLKRCLRRPEGIIIVTGPTGSGKTTTLYSMLSFINSIDVNIMTLEDPVEYQLPLIRQTNVREGSIDFHSGIKSLMRQDPDIIFIGEVRDEETALMAVRAALTGHQVFTSLHTNDALGAIPRLGDIGVPAHLLAGSLIASIAQRLARKLCEHCKRPKLADEEDCRIMQMDPSEPPTIYEAVGCEKCDNRGHKGRMAVVEILRVDPGMDELIATHATRNHMVEYALENGFVPMVQDGIAKVLKGQIDLPELIKTVDLTDRL